MNFIDFWDYTPAETYLMITIGYEKLKYEAVQHAEILTWVANAPHAQRSDKKLWSVDDFLPEFAKEDSESQMSVEELERRWIEACK